MNQPLVSICIPAYNHEDYVRECVESVIAQDYGNIELLVVDDGSTDSTWARLCELKAECENRFSRVEFRHRENRGRVQTFKELLDMARGEYVGEIASDDAYLPGAISLLADYLTDHEDCGLVVGINELMDSAGRRCFWTIDREVVYGTGAAYQTLDDWIASNCKLDLNGPKFGDYRTLLWANHVPNGYLKRLHLVKRIDAYREDAPLEDWWFHLQFSKIANYRHLDVATFRYRWHGCNTAGNSGLMMQAERATLKLERTLFPKVKLPLRAWVLLHLPGWVMIMLSQIKRRMK